jgi:hypothetical protein
VGIGVGDVAAFDGVGVGDFRGPVDEDFDFGLGVAVGLGTGVCPLRSTPRWVPRPTAALPGLGVLAGVYGLGFKEDKNDRFGVGVGVGVDAA